MVGADRFIEVFVDTPLEVCEQRDTKGIYVKARRGEIENLTSINDPYESPQKPEIVIETVSFTPEQNADFILAFLKKQGFVLNQIVEHKDNRKTAPASFFSKATASKRI